MQLARHLPGFLAALAAAGCAFAPAEPELPFIAQPAAFALPDHLRSGNHAIDGEVLIAVLVDSSGHPVDLLVVGSSDPALEPIALDAVVRTSFVPARDRGRGIAAHVGVRVDFSGDTPAMSSQRVETLGLAGYRRGRSADRRRYFQADELDEPLRLVRDVRPEPQDDSGAVKVQFFVQPDGTVRMPVIVSSGGPDLDLASLQAVERWQFTSPRRQGEPVHALVRQEIRFGVFGNRNPLDPDVEINE